MSIPQEYIKNYPKLSVVPAESFSNGRVSQPYFRDNKWRYKDDNGEHLLIEPVSFANFTTAEFTVIFGTDLLLTHPLSIDSEATIFLLPMLTCHTSEYGYNVGDRVTGFLDLVCQFQANNILVSIPQNGIKIPKRNGDRKLAKITPSNWKLSVEILAEEAKVISQTTAEFSVIWGTNLLLEHSLGAATNHATVVMLPMLTCDSSEYGYNVGDRITGFLDLICQYQPTEILVSVPQNGIKIPKRNGNRKLAKITPSNWKLSVEILVKN